MGVMPKKKTLTVQRVLALVIAYITLSVGGGVAASLFLLPAVFRREQRRQGGYSVAVGRRY